MANSTYLELTNELLRRLLEEELTASSFASARSTQATAKDCIRASINEINAKEREWPFQLTVGTQVLTIGQCEYTFPTDYKMADWESFYIEKDDTLDVSTTPLDMISRDEWFKLWRPRDLDNATLGLQVPQCVFDSNKSQIKSFGVTPAPNAAYTVKFEYYANDTQLSAYSDEVSIPKDWDYVILNGALKHFYMFKDNTEQASIWMGEFDRTLSQMRHTLMPKKDNMRDTRVNFGGSTWRGSIVSR